MQKFYSRMFFLLETGLAVCIVSPRMRVILLNVFLTGAVCVKGVTWISVCCVF